MGKHPSVDNFLNMDFYACLKPSTHQEWLLQDKVGLYDIILILCLTCGGSISLPS